MGPKPWLLCRAKKVLVSNENRNKLCAIARNEEYPKESPKGDSFVYTDIFLEYDDDKQSLRFFAYDLMSQIFGLEL